MKKLLLLCVVCCASTAYAQDVIVKRDGSAIISKVLEVNPSDIKYKKFSNQQGPTYTINKSEVMTINYEGGDKDTFEEVAQPTANTSSKTSTPFGVNPNLAEDNLKLVREFNSHDPVYIGNDTQKKCGSVAKVLGIKEGSIIETPELKASFAMKIWYGKLALIGNRVVEERITNIGDVRPFNICNHQYKMVIILKNKTNKTIFVDLANSHILRKNQAYPYYAPMATSTTQGSSSGGSVNLGAVAGAMGVGGSIGSLANGVNVGGSNTTVNTKITYSQRVVSIPPMSTYTMDPVDIGQGKICGPGNNWITQNDLLKDAIVFIPKDFKRGDKINMPPLENINPLGAFVTYSFDESMSSTQSMRMDFYLRQLLGVRSEKDIDYSQSPLIFF